MTFYSYFLLPENVSFLSMDSITLFRNTEAFKYLLSDQHKD